MALAINTRVLVLVALAAALASQSATVVAQAQASARVHRIGYLAPIALGVPPLRQALGALGYVDGRNLELIVRTSDGDGERLPALARELLQAGVDLIVAASPPAIRAARNATSTVPIVMGFVSADPVRLGLVESYARPGGNITGIALISDETIGKRLAILKELLPQARRIALLTDRNAQISAPQIDAAQKAAPQLAIEFIVIPVGGPDDYAGAFSQAAAQAQGVLMLTSPLLARDAQRIAELATRHRLPMVCDWREVAEAGCLLSYGPSLRYLSDRIADKVHRILRGARPGELAIERPDTFELAYNPVTEARLGIAVPMTLRVRAQPVQ